MISKNFSRCFTIFIIIVFFLKKSFNPKSFLQSIAVPFLAIDSQIERGVDEVLLRMESRENLIKICKALESENLTLKLQLQENRDLNERLKNIKNLLEIGEKNSYKKIYGGVIGRKTSAWFESIIVNKGSMHGVRMHAPVIGRGHIIGKVEEVSEQFSVVTLTSSPKFHLAVQLENFSIPLVFTGTGSDLRKNDANKFEIRASGIVKNIPTNVLQALRTGAKIFAASFAHMDFQVPLGNVIEWQKQADDMFLQVVVDLPEITNNLREILIIIPDDL
ncbi:MAG: rod shape-determining protein MreC [Puniceicoccales bacterium]|jgi:cell shape-determining protein MreC|nr:rod shape-determining protein MreC [Puniceicoccales bacterium]